LWTAWSPPRTSFQHVWKKEPTIAS
jgi:hypothetical protein